MMLSQELGHRPQLRVCGIPFLAHVLLVLLELMMPVHLSDPPMDGCLIVLGPSAPPFRRKIIGTDMDGTNLK